MINKAKKSTPQVLEEANQSEDDAAYAASMLRQEYAAFSSLIQAALVGEKQPEKQVAVLSKVVAEQLAILSSRMTLLETILLEGGAKESSVPKAGRPVQGSKPKRPVVGSKKVVEFAKPGILLTAKQLSEISNTYSLEGEDEGAQFCWSGPLPVTRFLVNVAREDVRRFALHVVSFASPDMKESLKVKIDSREVEHEWLDRPIGSILTFCAPKSRQALGGKTQISIELASTYCPADHSESSDVRNLGMAMTHLVLTE
ncbi:hypothetical protein ACTL6U_05755 [Rhodovibrionaceae bacterium A322]